MTALGFALAHIDEIPYQERTVETVLQMIVERGRNRALDVHENASPIALSHLDLLKVIVQEYQQHLKQIRIPDGWDVAE